MATHSSTLAWKFPWTVEPGRLPSMGSQRVRHDLATQQQQPNNETSLGQNEQSKNLNCTYKIG